MAESKKQEGRMRYYYADENNQATGPKVRAELRFLLAKGVIKPDTFVIEEGGNTWVKLEDILEPVPSQIMPSTPALSPRTISQSKAPPVPPPVQSTKKKGLATYQKALIVVVAACIIVQYLLPKESVVNSDGGVLGDGRKGVFSSLAERTELSKRVAALALDPVLWAFQNTYNRTPNDPYAQQFYKQTMEKRSTELFREALLRAESEGRIFFIEPGTRVRILDSYSDELGKVYKIRITDGQYAGREGWIGEDCLER
jgi:hypothetical protein